MCIRDRFIDSKLLYEVVGERECWQRSGKPNNKRQMGDLNKGGEDGRRSRFVARDFKTTRTDGFYASTPPWEVAKLLLSLLASQGGEKKERRQRDE